MSASSRGERLADFAFEIVNRENHLRYAVSREPSEQMLEERAVCDRKPDFGSRVGKRIEAGSLSPDQDDDLHFSALPVEWARLAGWMGPLSWCLYHTTDARSRRPRCGKLPPRSRRGFTSDFAASFGRFEIFSERETPSQKNFVAFAPIRNASPEASRPRRRNFGCGWMSR
jgi:hypothetical protein